MSFANISFSHYSHRWHPELKEWLKKSPSEIKQERLDRQDARRKKQEEKAQKKKEKLAQQEEGHPKARLKVETDDKAQADKEGEPVLQDDHGIKEPEKEPAKVRRNIHDEIDEPALEMETSGLAHLRRRSRRNRK